MALPLPNTLSFTSGDPLTAEEMNKMWANDKFLADNINAGKLVIKVNGQLVNNSFDANKSTDVDIDLTIPEYVSDLTDHADYAKVADVPTKTSELTNDGDGTLPFLTSADVPGIPNDGKLTITVNGSTVGEFTADQATNTTVPLTIPEYVTDLADSGDYSTTVQVSQLISTAIAGIASAKLSYEIVQTLPTEGIDASTVYMILQQESGADDYYDQYMYINNQWAHLGTTEIDLSQYAKLSDIPTVPDVYDSTITLYKSDGTTLVDTFTLNQSTNKSITLPEGGSSKTVTIKDADANAIDSFALNIQTDKTVTLPAATGTKYGMTKVQVSSTDLTEGSVLPQGEIYGVTGAPTTALRDVVFPVETADISDSAVTTAKIANSAVTSAKLTFPIKRESTADWKDARDKAVVANTNKYTAGGYAPGVDIKSKNGDWSIGVLDSTDTLYFSYVTDSDYNAGNNRSSAQTLSADGNNSFIPNMAKVVTYTTTDPGKNSTLAANRFVAVYEN